MAEADLVDSNLTAGRDLTNDSLTLDLGNGVRLELVLISAGRFMMGSPETEMDRFDDETHHEVTLTRPFYIGKYQITQDQYQQVLGTNPSQFKSRDLPVETVTWDDAQSFCRKVRKQTGFEVRLPTEAEWEYACRAGTETAYCSGNGETDLARVAWYNKNSTATYFVGQKAANPWGVYDMHGNVCEWCEDGYSAYPQEPTTDPRCRATDNWRVLRGGCWDHSPVDCRSARRVRSDHAYRAALIGFRVVVECGSSGTLPERDECPDAGNRPDAPNVDAAPIMPRNNPQPDMLNDRPRAPLGMCPSVLSELGKNMASTAPSPRGQSPSPDDEIDSAETISGAPPIPPTNTAFLDASPTLRPGTERPSRGDLALGTELVGRYVVTRRLGCGGMGVVYRVTDKETQVEYAIKVLPPSIAGSQQTIQDLKREIAVAQQVTHQNLLRFNYLSLEGPIPFLLMEYIDGEDLETFRVRSGGRVVGEGFSRILEQVLTGLDYLHEKGFVHLDLKPQNIMVAKNGEVKITDFGISKGIPEQIFAPTDPNQPLTGTPAFMAPEQLRSELCDRRTDLYALGVLSYLLLLGEYPFPTHNREGVIAWHLGPEADLRRVPNHLRPFLEGCLRRQSKDRFASAKEALAVLRGTPIASPGQVHLPVPSRDTIPKPHAYIRDELHGIDLANSDALKKCLAAALCQKVPLSAEETQAIRRALTLWADSIPHHEYRSFGNEIEIIEVWKYPSYNLAISTQYESRTVVSRSEPFLGIPLPPKKITEDSIDVWSYEWPVVEDFSSDTNEHRIDDSQEVAPCSRCGADGLVTCYGCGGSGSKTCTLCGGRGSVQGSRSVQRLRRESRYENGRSYEVNVPYDEVEYYQSPCVSCNARGKVTCQACAGQGTVRCSECSGKGAVVSYSAIVDEFHPTVVTRTTCNPSLTKELHGMLKVDLDYAPVLALAFSEFDTDFANMLQLDDLSVHVRQMISESKAEKVSTNRIVRQRIAAASGEVIELRYRFQSNEYKAHFIGKNRTVKVGDSPLVRLAQNLTAMADSLLNVKAGQEESGKLEVFKAGLDSLEKCLDMKQDEKAVQRVLERFASRMSDAYAHMASKKADFNDWEGVAESLVFSDKANRLQPGHSAATAHEKRVLGKLAQTSWAPTAIFVLLYLGLGLCSGKIGMCVVSGVGSVLWSYLQWSRFSRKTTKTALVLSLTGIHLAIVVLSCLAISLGRVGTREEDKWWACLVFGVLLLLLYLSKLLLPKKWLRDASARPRDLRAQLNEVQALVVKDWKIIPWPRQEGDLTPNGGRKLT